ncbi:MAG: NFACT family protein [Candidatus Thermoplasmatota archaeon]|nr:NFACT family protein [Candidatus Thermoplasmatota archaeon]
MLKKSLSSMAVRRFVLEAKAVEGAFFQKAYQIDYDTLILRFSIKRSILEEVEPYSRFRDLLLESVQEPPPSPEGISLGEGGGSYLRFDLYFKMGGYLFISPKVNREMPTTPSPFAMKLRRSLANRVLRDISQVGMDRMVCLTFNPSQGEEEPWRLYLELFGDGNAVLVKGDTIQTPFTSKAWASRTIKRGEIYLPPPSGIDAFELTPDGLNGSIEGSQEDLVRFLIKRCSLPPHYAEEVCLRADLDKKADPKDLSAEDRKRLFREFRGLLDEVLDERDIYVHFLNGEPVLVEPALLGSFWGDVRPSSVRSRYSEGVTGAKGDHFTEMGSINQALELHMFEEDDPREVRKEEGRSRKVLKIKAMIESQEKARAEKEAEADMARRIADALYLDYTRIDAILKDFDAREYVKDSSKFKGIDGYDPGTDPLNGRIKVKMDTEAGPVTAELETSLDLNQNADLLYNRSKTAKRKLEGIGKALEISYAKLEKVQREADDKEDEGKGKSLRSFWFETYRWCFTSGRVLLIGGRDSKTNERVVKKFMRDSDLYAHADIQGASSIVLRVDKGQEADDTSKEQAVHFSVLNSKAWHAKVGAAGGYWVLPDQVSRTPGSGEFLPKGSFIIRGKKNFIEKLPLEGAVGTVYIEGVPKIMFGPVNAVRDVCQGSIYVVRPGKGRKSDAAKIIARELGGELDQVMSVLPSGDMDITKDPGG